MVEDFSCRAKKELITRNKVQSRALCRYRLYTDELVTAIVNKDFIRALALATEPNRPEVKPAPEYRDAKNWRNI